MQLHVVQEMFDVLGFPGLTNNKEHSESDSECHPVSLDQLHFLVACNGIHQMVQLQTVDEKQKTETQEIPPPIAELVDKFQNLFEAPKGLPQSRPFDHQIPLIPGAQPVNIKSYRYNPAQKDEIERQIKEMLQQGIIQPSYSPFASPVLLVQKKDLTWRFCVDYRQLNAITVRNRFPMPVVEELLDELAGSKWFTSLDLKAGYHQIRMATGDVFKTAFKTHLGHYEFKVMPYGLSEALGTFQGVMNFVLAGLIRHGVIVFIDDILVHTATLSEHVCLLLQVFE